MQDTPENEEKIFLDMLAYRHTGQLTHYATRYACGQMIRSLMIGVLVLFAVGGCSYKVTVEDLEGFEIAVSTQDDVLRKVGEPNKKLDAGEFIVYAYSIDGEEYVLNFVNTPDGYRFLKTSKLTDEFRNFLKDKYENLTEQPFPLAWQ